MPLLDPVPPGHRPRFRDDEAAPPSSLPTEEERRAMLRERLDRIARLSAVLRAEGHQALLVVLQSRDAGGKDGTIRRVFGAVDPQALRVTAFGVPSGEETRHDFLWRAHRAVPPYGAVGVWNRSHYEDVLVARVRGLVPEKTWSRRYQHIADFERMLTENRVRILKLFLHVSRDEQARRQRKRIESPEKRWKFDAGDLKDRERWDEYTSAYRDVFERCGTREAPWWVVPADDKRVRDLLVADVVAETLEAMGPRVPDGVPGIERYLDELG